MALLDYYQLVIIPFILLFSIPLAIFATITSVLAFTILLIRVLIIYAELAVAVIPYFLGTATASTKHSYVAPSNLSSIGQYHSPPSNNSPTSRRNRKRRGSAGSSTSTTSLTPVASTTSLPIPLALPTTPLPLNQSSGSARDFEGVGGWRLEAPSDNDSLWTSINSRLELPADHVRRHKRSLTSGSVPMSGSSIPMLGERRRGGDRSYSPELVMGMSPNTSRARTPPTGMGGGVEGYFPSQGSPRVGRKSSVSLGSNSSGSSKGSGGLSMKNRT